MAAPSYHEQDEFEGNLLADKYRIVRRIGRGGMGSVYEATHVLMDRTVAIKVVRANYAEADPASLERFRLEAKASSCLSHPNIMTVYDFGITAQGVAYLVMDYIDGEGLDVMLRRERNLSTDRVVDIFTQACSALAHAHDKGIIHRDLKPSNIMLVREDNGSETVKIVDFGIARMLPGRARTAEVINDGGQVIGSPLYMSPEQCMNDDQDGRSDVYSLGCLLYEALAGFPPISDKHVLGIMYKHLNEPPKPFAAIVPQQNVPIEIESVVLKALAKNPNDRHENMRTFAAELNSALTSAKATQDQHRYVQRPSSSDAVFFDRDDQSQQPRAAKLPDTFDELEQHYLRQLRSAADQYGAQHPKVVPCLHHLADYYISRNKPSRAERHLRTAVEVLVHSYGAWDVRVAESVLKLAELYKGGGRGHDAEPLYHDLLAIKQNAVGKMHPDIPFLTLRLAEVYLSTGRMHEAYKYYSLCLRHAEAVFGPDDPVLSAIIVGLAAVVLQSNKVEEAAWLYHRALELTELNLGPHHPSVIGPLVSLAVVYRKMQNPDEAEQMLHRAILVHRQNYDTETTEICHAYWLLAEVYSNRGQIVDAESLYDHVLGHYEDEKREDESLAQLYNNYAVHFIRCQQPDRAEVQFLRALKIREAMIGRNSEQVAHSLNLLATLYHSQEKLELAEQYYHRSLAACRQLGDDSASQLASENLRALGDIYTFQRRFEEAEPAYIKALEVRKADADPTQPPDAHTQHIIGSLMNLYVAANSARPPHLKQSEAGFEGPQAAP